MFTAEFMTFYYLRPILAAGFAELVYFIIFASRFVASFVPQLTFSVPLLPRRLFWKRVERDWPVIVLFVSQSPSHFPHDAFLCFACFLRKQIRIFISHLCSLNHFIFFHRTLLKGSTTIFSKPSCFKSTQKNYNFFKKKPWNIEQQTLPNTNKHFSLCYLQGPSLTMAISPF